MPRRMSCSMTIDAVRERRKTVTRRHVDTWRTLRPGDRLTLIEKGMGLAKGEKQVVLAEVEVTDVRVEHLSEITWQDVEREGFPGHSPAWFVDFFCRTHRATYPRALVRRIEWRYLDDEEAL